MGLIISIALFLLAFLYETKNNFHIWKQHNNAKKENNTLVYMNDRGETRNVFNGAKVKIITDYYDHKLYVTDLFGKKLVCLTDLIKEREVEEAAKINEENDRIAKNEGRRWSVHLYLPDENHKINRKYDKRDALVKPAELGEYNWSKIDLNTGRMYKLNKRDKSRIVKRSADCPSGIDIYSEYYITYFDDPYKSIEITEKEAIELGVNDYQWYKKSVEGPKEMFNRIYSEFYKVGGLA